MPRLSLRGRQQNKDTKIHKLIQKIPEQRSLAVSSVLKMLGSRCCWTVRTTLKASNRNREPSSQYVQTEEGAERIWGPKDIEKGCEMLALNNTVCYINNYHSLVIDA